MTTPFRHSVRLLACGGCGAPLEASVDVVIDTPDGPVEASYTVTMKSPHRSASIPAFTTQTVPTSC